MSFQSTSLINPKLITSYEFQTLPAHSQKILLEQREAQFQRELQEMVLTSQEDYDRINKGSFKQILFTPEELFLKRLCNNRDHTYWFRICDNCEKPFESDLEGKSIIHKDFCCSPFCNDMKCYQFRIAFAKQILQSYFYAFPTWREKRQKWLHLIFGSKRVKVLTETSLADFRKDLMKVLNHLRKEYSNPHMVSVLDIAYNGKTFYIHAHVGMRIRGHMDYEEINKFSLKNNLKFKKADGKFSRKPKQLINYFAQRLAGKFEHEQDGSSWFYSDLFSPKEYIDLFYRKKRFLTRGFDQKQVKEIRKKLKDLNFEEVLSPNNTNNKPLKTCQFCGCKDFSRSFVDNPNKQVIPPPDYVNGNADLYNPSIVKSKLEVQKI